MVLLILSPHQSPSLLRMIKDFAVELVFVSSKMCVLVDVDYIRTYKHLSSQCLPVLG